MSRIQELIKEMCPNGVKFDKLENCCNILDNKRKPSWNTISPGK